MADFLVVLALVLAVAGVSGPGPANRLLRAAWLLAVSATLVICALWLFGRLTGYWNVVTDKDLPAEVIWALVAGTLVTFVVLLHRTGTYRISPRSFVTIALAPGPATRGPWERVKLWWLTNPQSAGRPYRLRAKWFRAWHDLATLQLTNADLENAYLVARQRARERLADDAQVALRFAVVGGTSDERRLSFDAWSELRNRGRDIRIAETGEVSDSDLATRREIGPVMWRVDDSWRDLVIQAATIPGEWTSVNLHPVGAYPGWSRWQLQFATGSPAAVPRYFGLHNGKIEECPESVVETNW